MDSITAHDETAENYEDHPQSSLWHVPDYMFGMCFEYLAPGQRVLDVGIGTGLSAIPFSRFGLEVHGIDGSSAMLDVCRKKGRSERLIQHDFLIQPWPIETDYSLILSAGVFHFFDELDLFFEEVDRVLQEKGIFCFTVMDCRLSERFKKIKQQDSPKPVLGLPVSLYTHSEAYIKLLTEKFGYEILKRGEFLMEDMETNLRDDYLFSIYVTKKTGQQ